MCAYVDVFLLKDVNPISFDVSMMVIPCTAHTLMHFTVQIVIT
jgi:hypothetical protein